MSQKSAGVAYSGLPPTKYPQTSIFDFVFGNPFQHEQEYLPASQIVPRIDDSHPVFVDNKTSKIITYFTTLSLSLTPAFWLSHTTSNISIRLQLT